MKRFVFRPSLLATAMLLFVGAGCASQPRADIERELRAAGIAQAITLSVESLPVDVNSAQERAQLPIEEAIRAALATDTEIQTSLAEVRLAAAEARQSRLLPNPILNVALRFPETGGTPIVEAGLSADVVALLTRPRRISAADARLRATCSNAVSTVLDVLQAVQERYVAVQALDAEVANLQGRMQVAEQLVQLADSRVRAGESNQLDLLSLQSDQAALEVEIIDTTLKQRQGRLALARQIGQPSLPADWSLSEWAPPRLRRGTEDEWIGAALKHRPEVQARRWELAALGDDLAAARWSLVDGFEGGAEAERDGDWSIGPAVSAPLPLFDWGQAKREAAHAQVVAARHRLTQTQRQVVHEIRDANAQLNAAHDALRLMQERVLPLASARRQQAEAAYNQGFADISAVLLAEQQMQDAASKRIELQHSLASATFHLERAAGGPGVTPRVDSDSTTQATTEKP